MSMEEAGGYVIDVLTLAACAVVIVAALCAVMNESPLRKWRKLHTPPCRLCAHYVKDGYAECTCPAAVLRKEKLRGLTCTKVRSDDVRGTRVCRFEPKGDEE